MTILKRLTGIDKWQKHDIIKGACYHVIMFYIVYL